MTAPALQALAQLFTERMLNTAAEGMVLAGSVWALRPLIRRQSSGTRFAIWFLALLAIVALPFVAGSGFAVSHSTTMAPAKLRGVITLSSSWALYLFAGWAVGAALMLFRLSIGLCYVVRFRSNCREVELTGLDPAVAEVFRDFGSRCRTKLCVSGQVSAPAAIGFVRPAIVFPAWLLPQLSAAEVEAILLHENAHLCRWDHWTNLAQKLVKAVFFFHPAVWWIESRLTLEREMACDDLVLAQSTSPKAYASFLISFAEKLQNARGLTLAQALVSRTRQMSLRVAQILDAKRQHRTGLWKPVLGAGAGLLAIVFGAAPHVPRLVAFQNQPGQRHPALMRMQASREKTLPAAVAARGNPRLAVVPPVAQKLSFAPQPRAIPAVYHPRAAVLPARLKATAAGKPLLMRAQAVQKEIPSQETFVILQTTQYDASGSGVWTLCIWQVHGGSLAEKKLESAIVLGI